MTILNNANKFMMAGNALFTIKNTKTGNRFTFKIRKAKDSDDIFFVSLLNGSDNYSNYSYMGIIRGLEFLRTAKSKITESATSFKAFSWIWNHRNALPQNIEIHHESKCGRCGRRLTVPESIESGFGPECINKI